MEKYKFSQLPYVPNDFEDVQKTLDAFAQKIQAAGSVSEVLEILEKGDELQENVQFHATLAYIRSSLDCTDEYYANAAEREAVGCAGIIAAPYYRAILASPYLPQLEERFGPEFRPRIEKECRVSAAGHEWMAREEALTSRYQQKKAMLQIPFQGKTYSEGEMMAFYDSPNRQVRLEARKAVAESYLAQKEDFASMLLELVSLREQIAKANGFASYLEYANEKFHRRGYGEAELTAFCGQVKEDLVPLLRELQEEQRKALGVEKLMSYDRSVRFADGNAVPAGDAVYLTEASKGMYDAISPAFGAFFRGMVETESLDVAASPNKVAGMGFCTDLKRGYYPYVFGNCNGTETDVSVFTHEIGHAWQGELTARQTHCLLLTDMALDAVEIPSKTMELFAYPYAEGFFGRDGEKYRQGHFRQALREIGAYCTIHELNTWIYTHPGATFEEMVEASREIDRQYDPDLDYGELDEYNRKGADLMRNMAVYMFPRYVISYSLSEVCAMELFARMGENPKEAWESFEKLCASGGSRNYPDTLAQAGLAPAYAPGSVKRVVEFARVMLKQLG